MPRLPSFNNTATERESNVQHMRGNNQESSPITGRITELINNIRPYVRNPTGRAAALLHEFQSQSASEGISANALQIDSESLNHGSRLPFGPHIQI